MGRRRLKNAVRAAVGISAAAATLLAGGLVAFADDTNGTITPASDGQTAVCAPLTDAEDATANQTPAQKAELTASYTASWNNIEAVRDGESVFTKGDNSQVWGTYSGNRPDTQWLQYSWSDDVTLTGASVSFWRDNDSDTAGDGVAVPQSWKLQTSDDGKQWADVALVDDAAYPRDKDKANDVTFAATVKAKYLRAVFTAASDGKTNAAIGVSEFAVTAEGDVPTNPNSGLAVLRSDSFQVGVSRETGGIYNLTNTADAPQCTNYVINPTTKTAGSRFNVDDSRWTGDIGTWTNGKAQNTGLSDKGRTVVKSKDGASVTVSYDSGKTENRAGAIKDFDLTERYALSGDGGDVLDWDITVDNTSGAELTMDDLTLPMLFNSWWDSSSQDNIYEQNVSRHAYVAKDGSYIYWQRPSGTGPYLVMVPKEGTSLEFKDKAKPGEGTFAESDPSWEGLTEFAIHSNHVQNARKGKIDGYLDATKLTLDAGDSATYGFTFRWADSYDDLHDVLYEAGVVDAVSYPGYTVSTDSKATLAVRAKDGVSSITGGGGKGTKAGEDAKIVKTGSKNGYDLYEIEFASLGENYLTVHFGKDGKRESVMQYNSIKPIEELIDTHADFLVDNQQAKNPSKGYDGAFLQWNMAAAELVTRDSATMQGQSEWNKRWMAGGADDLGLSPAEFLSEKNAESPDKTQVKALDYYIENFLLGYLQNERKSDAGVACTGDECNERTWNIYHWYDGTDGDRPSGTWNSGNVGEGAVTWRVMNAPHVWNTYYNMYRIAKAYPSLAKDMKFTADEYLDMAYNTANAFYNHDLDYKAAFLDNSSREMGAMGEGTIPEIIASLKAAGKTDEAGVLTAHAKNKLGTYQSKDYPFASEMSIDTTAFESTYTMAKMFGDTALQKKTTLASLSARGTQPLWYYNGGDNRHMGESWWNLGYETQLGAWQQQSYLENTDVAAAGFDADELMRSTYGAYMAGWSNINMGQISSDKRNIGAAAWQYQSEGGDTTASGSYRMIKVQNHWWMWSGEADLGFWGALRTASVNVVDDKILGEYAYGADMKTGDGTYVITPKDGVRRKAVFYNLGKLGFELSGAKYTKATVAADGKSVTLELENTQGDGAYTPTVDLTNLPEGEWKVSVAGSGSTADVTRAADGSATVPLSLEGSTATVTISTGEGGGEVGPAPNPGEGSDKTDGSDKGEPGQSSGKGDNGKADAASGKTGSLTVTGSEVAGVLAVALVAVTVGTAVLIRKRRRDR